METPSLKYTVIKSSEQYYTYCNRLEELLTNEKQTQEIQDEAELLTLLIQTWDAEQNSFAILDPIQLLRALMEENGLKARDLVNILGISKGVVSEILHYKKGLSKEVVRKLAEHFKISPDALNKPYTLLRRPKTESPSAARARVIGN